MKIEKISDERIKVTLQPTDMKKWNISYERLSEDSPEINHIVWNILIKIAEETGINFKNCRLIIEVVGTPEGNCILYINKKELQTRYKYKKKKQISESAAVYSFKSFEDVINFAKNNLYYCFLFDGKNTIYRAEDSVLLVINVLPETKKYLQAFNDKICEYADIYKKTELYSAYLDEHFKPIIKKNALKILYYKI